MQPSGDLAPGGDLFMQVVRHGGLDLPAWPERPASKLDIIQHALPHDGVPRAVQDWRSRNLPNLLRGAVRVALARKLRLTHAFGQLWLTVIRGDGSIEELGLASMRVVTDTGVGFIVDAFQNLVELENMKYHGFGTGTNNEAAGDTALQTELTTQYATDNTRPTGTTTEGATANIYRTVATVSPDSGGTIAVTEHGIFSQAANSGGVLLDRSKFSAVNLVAGSDSLQATYDLTFTSGS